MAILTNCYARAAHACLDNTQGKGKLQNPFIIFRVLWPRAKNLTIMTNCYKGVATPKSIQCSQSTFMRVVLKLGELKIGLVE